MNLSIFEFLRVRPQMGPQCMAKGENKEAHDNLRRRLRMWVRAAMGE